MSLFFRSLLVLVLLFGLVFAVGIGVVYHYHLPVSWAVGLAVTVVSLQFILAPYIIDWIYNIHWYPPEAISNDFADYLRILCARRGLPVPRFGIIEDGNPNAFTYGHFPSDARLVVTRGLRDMLTEEEFRAVVAHEVGHIRHYDFIVMTIAALASILLYITYRWSRSSSGRSAPAALVGAFAYAAYVLSQYLVLFLSRLREYFADQHASYSVNDSNAIATALIKIGYGLARTPQTGQPTQGANQQPTAAHPAGQYAGGGSSYVGANSAANSDPFAPLAGGAGIQAHGQSGDSSPDGIRQSLGASPALNHSQCLGSLGICSFSSSITMALYSTSPTGQFSLQQMLNAMQWDLWNPWAKYFELHSTHPLIARRVQAASDVARRLGQRPVIPPCAAPKESLWPQFIFDLIVMSLPWLGFFFGMLMSLPAMRNVTLHDERTVLAMIWSLRAVPLLTGIGWLMRLAMSYPGSFKSGNVADLVGRVDVSPVRCVPVEIEGTVIGRGVPGIAWSKDLVLQDDTGFVTLVYNQPLGILEFLFGLIGAGRLVGQRVRVRGWYRRGSGPYIELKDAITQYGTRTRCYYVPYLWAVATLITILGVVLLCIRP